MATFLERNWDSLYSGGNSTEKLTGCVRPKATKICQVDRGVQMTPVVKKS